MHTSVVTSRSAGQIFSLDTQVLLVACLMVANLVWAESKFASSSVRPLYSCWITSSHTIHPRFAGLFWPADIEPPNLRPWDSVENRDSYDEMILGRYDTVRNIIKLMKPSRTRCSFRTWCCTTPPSSQLPPTF